MKILRIVSAGYEQGGAENGIVLTNEVLRARGHTVQVLSSDVNPTQKHFSDHQFKSVYPNGFRKLTSAAFNFDAFRVTKRVLREFQPDVVILHTMSQTTASVLFLLKKYPTIMIVHGPEIYTKSLLPWYLKKQDYHGGTFKVSDLTLPGRLHYYYFLWVCRPLYLLGLPNVDRMVALSSYTMEMLETEKFKPVLIPNGVGLLPKHKYSTRVPRLLYAGRLEKFKGIDDLINAMPLIIKQFPGVELFITGEGEHAGALKSLVNKLGIEKSVHFTGHLTRKQIEKAYQQCSIFVLPSTWPETFGKVGVEAMSVGRPVIATRVGGVEDWLHDTQNGFLVDPFQPPQIADRVMKLLENPKLARAMALEAHISAQKFSIIGMAESIEQLATELKQTRPYASGSLTE